MIRARSADFRAGFKAQKERSWHDKTLHEIIETIAGEHQLNPVITETLKDIFISHIDQTNESDANLLSRLVELHDAIATVKNGALLVLPIGHAQTVSGVNLQPVTLKGYRFNNLFQRHCFGQALLNRRPRITA